MTKNNRTHLIAIKDPTVQSFITKFRSANPSVNLSDEEIFALAPCDNNNEYGGKDMYEQARLTQIQKAITDPNQFFLDFMQSCSDRDEIIDNYFSHDESKIAKAKIALFNHLSSLVKMNKLPIINSLRLKESGIDRVMIAHKPEIISGFLDNLNKRFEYDCTIDPNHVHLKNWLKATRPNYTDVDFAVVHDWCMNVRRNQLGLKISNQICPIFYSKRGRDGKSWMINELIKPMKSVQNGLFVIDNMGCNQMRDQSFGLMLENKYICFFDEMSQLRRDILDTLKQIITSGFMSSRKFHTQHVVNTENRCMFIGTSNKPLTSIITDNSQQRYYQIDCGIPESIKDNKEKFVSYWDNVNASIDYDKLWASINPYEEKLVGTAYNELRKIQKLNEYRDSVDRFLDEYFYDKSDRTVKACDLYLDYKEFHNVNYPGTNPTNDKVFGLKVREHEMFVEKIRHGYGYSYTFKTKGE